MKLTLALACALSLVAGTANAACRVDESGEAHYAVCEFNPETGDIRLFLNDEAGEPYGDFGALKTALEAKGETLLFAMNAGMYRKDRSPVGLYIENGEEFRKLSTKDGPGNFHLKPNGVFWIGEDSAAHVTDTERFRTLFPPPLAGEVSPKATEGGRYKPPQSASLTAPPQAGEQKPPKYATQSGPMLVVDGEIHPRFLVDATSKKRRNGVGVKENGTVVFAISDDAVTFHTFATYFRDALQCPNALFLDGSISRIYAPEIERAEPGIRMGPIVGVVAAKD